MNVLGTTTINDWAKAVLKATTVKVPGLHRGELRRARLRRGWTQEELAERITVLRDTKLGADTELPAFTFQQVARLEAGRVRVCLGEEGTEPLWWALVALGVALSDQPIHPMEVARFGV